MKAEHRKELETNILADRMGTIIQQAKGASPRRTVLYLFLIVLAGVVLFIIYKFWTGDPTAATDRWIQLERGDVFDLEKESENNSTKKAVLLQFAEFHFSYGVRQLAANPMQGLRSVYTAQSYYDFVERIAGDDEKEWKAEARYGLAMVEETLAMVDYKKLATAKTSYEKLAEDLPDTMRGRLAKDRAKDLADKDKGPKLTEFYKSMNKEYGPWDLIVNQKKNVNLPDIMPKQGR